MTLPPIIQLVGSKTYQRKNILPILARYRRSLYVEPFGGAGGLLFGKKQERAEVYNDANRSFVALMRCVRSTEKLSQLEWILKLSPTSRELWYECKELTLAYMSNNERFAELKEAAALSEYDDDVVAAYAMFYAQNNGFGGTFLHSFGGGCTGNDAAHVVSAYRRKRDALHAYMKRLSTVTIENLDALDCLDKYDHETTLFYVDPPYITTAKYTDGEKCYGGNTIDHAALVDKLYNLKGAFVLSCYDNEVYKPLLERATRFEWNAYSSCSLQSKKGAFDRTEVVYASRLKDTDRRLF